MTKGRSYGVQKLIISALKAKAAEGKTKVEAASELGISYQTVCNYVAKNSIEFRKRVYAFKETGPYMAGRRCQLAVRLDADVYKALSVEAEVRGLSVGVTARAILEEILRPSMHEAAE